MKRVALLTIGTVLLAASVPAHPQGPLGRRMQRFRSDVPLILIRAIQAQPTIRYTGTYTVEFRQVQPPVRHQEYITRDGGRYRIDFPTDSKFSGQVIIEDETVRLYYHPNTNEILQLPPRHGEAWDKVAVLAVDPKIRLSVTAGEQIAGHKTDQVVVSDLSGNVVQRLFIEPGSGIIMKRQLFDMVGSPAGYFEFSSIDLNPKIDPSIFKIQRKDAKLITPLMQLQRVCQRRGFSYRFLTTGTGFQLEGVNGRKFAGIEGLVQTYLNGKVRLSVYQLKAPIDPDRLKQQAGPNQKFFSFQSAGETIVLIGNMPEKNLEHLGALLLPGTAAPASKL